MRTWVYVVDKTPRAKGKYCIHCCEFLCAIHLIIIFLFAFATLFRADSFNYTAMTHALPNILLMGGYVLDGRPTETLSEPDGVQTVKDRLPDNLFFMPPNQYVEIQKEGFDMDPNVLHKFDSVPFLLRDVALPRRSSTEKDPDTGTSIFVSNLEDRGPYNEMKQKYMAGLTQTDVERYVDRCTERMEAILPCSGHVHDCIYEAVRDMTFLIHTEKLPEQEDKDFIDTGVAAFSSVSKVYEVLESLFMPTVIQKHILKHDAYTQRLKDNMDNYDGLFKSLKQNGYKEEDILVEYLHNVFALTAQWTLLMEHMLADTVGNTSEAIYNHLQKHPVAAFTISSKDKDGNLPSSSKTTTHVLHHLEKIMHDGAPADSSKFVRCPGMQSYKTSPEKAVIVEGTEILEQEKHWAFGRGYRRCAGEVLTVEMMKRWSTIYSAREFTYVEGEVLGLFGLGYKKSSKVISKVMV